VFDVAISADSLDSPQIAAIARAAAEARRVSDQGLMPGGRSANPVSIASSSREGCITPAGKVNVKKRTFGHPSEEVFANLLDFYRIRWSTSLAAFPAVDKDGMSRGIHAGLLPSRGRPIHQLTTMKQALVTKKNPQGEAPQAIYPHVHIQVSTSATCRI